jgi:putative ABC transport system ATP-binding protein
VALRSLYVEPEVAPDPVDWPALEFHDVFRIYRSGPVETVALRGLDVRIERGEFVAVWGPSGSGKSTFLALAGGLDRPSAGEVRAFGDPLSGLTEADLARYRARTLAMVFQSDNLWSALSAEENVRVALTLAGRDEAMLRARSALDAFGLARRYAHPVHALSGGEQQRVAIAAAAAREARLVLADEPTGELDSFNERAVLDGFGRLRRDFGSTVVVVSHSDVVARAADRVIEIRDGRAVR